MAKIPGLMKRGGSFVYRANVPKDLHEAYGSKRQIWRTLDAKTESEAKREAHKAALAFMDEFNTKRAEIAASRETLFAPPKTVPAMTKRYDIATLVRLHRTNVLDREEAHGEALFKLYLDDPREFKRRVYNVVERAKLLDYHYGADEVRGFEGWIDHLYDEDADRVVAFIERKRIQGRIGQIKRWQAVKDFREFSQVVDKLAPDIAVDQRRSLIRALIEGEIAALSPLVVQDARTRFVADPVGEAEAPTLSSALCAPTPTLDSVKKSFLDDKRRAGTSMGACEEIYKAIDDFIEIIGDRQISDYKKADVRDYLSVIQSIPPNSRKKIAYRDLSLREVAAKAKGTKDKGPDIATVHKKFDAVAGLFRWLNRNYDHMPPNPFEEMRPQERKKNARDERHPFTLEQLNKIFSAPPYVGAKSASRWLTPGDTVLKDRGVYWLPLIALYSGMRLGEILQLRKCDVKEEDGITFFDVNDDAGKSVKTHAGHRRVPVHPILVGCGLLEHVSKLSSEETRLIHDIPLSGRVKDRSGRASRKMAELLIFSGAKTEKNSFHSFRHNFEDACRVAGVDHAIMNVLQGHVQGDMSDRYGNGKHAVARLHEAICMIQYKGILLPTAAGQKH